jgi:hypothetical protein
MRGNVKKVMKNHSEEYGKIRKTLPLVEDPAELWRGGGREKGGGERPDGHSKKTQETLYGYRAAFMEASQRQTDRRLQVSSSTSSWQVCCGFCESRKESGYRTGWRAART